MMTGQSVTGTGTTAQGQAERARDVEEILRAEAEAIHADKMAALNLKLPEKSDNKKAELYQTLNQLDSAALCLSGGGIRSAAFGLGVIQALAAHPRSAPTRSDKPGAPCDQADKCLLSRFHYLSTVSGGGYIGSWLSAWRSRSSWHEIWRGLVSRTPGSDRETPALGWLRSYSNYLTPKLGLTSADTWAAIALFCRNLILNWIIIIPIFCSLILVLKLAAVLTEWATHVDDLVELPFISATFPYIQATFAIAGLASLILSLSFIARSRPTRRDHVGPNQRQFLLRGLLPAFLSAAFLSQFFASDYVGGKLLEDGPDLLAKYSLFRMIVIGCICGMAIYSTSWFAARMTKTPRDLLCWTLAGSIYGGLVTLGVYSYILIPEAGIVSVGGEIRFSNFVLPLVLGWPWIIFSQVTADMIYVGLSDYQEGSDADREWLGRAAGWLVAAALIWLVLTFAVYFGAILGPDILNPKTQAALTSWGTTLTAGLGIITALLGTSSSTPAHGQAKNRWSVLSNIALMVAAPLFVIALLIGLSFLLDLFLLRTPLVPELFLWWSDKPSQAELDNVRDMLWLLDLPESILELNLPELTLDLSRTDALLWLVIGLIVSLGVAAIASYCMNINRFSLHALYRNRLMRAFLGASRTNRKPDAFTGFDLDDNPRAHDLWAKPEPNNWRPFHIINIALNIVSTKRLAWQERKAEPFVVTPLHAGSSELGFRLSSAYGGPDGISLGTAMAISGAAASPNMGYNSSPSITFLMTMLNVRLGWWLGNPGKYGEHTFMLDGPRWAIKPLLDEALGLTTDDSAYVYLSDGGHFENLGLYEAVRRRCRFIIAVDAGCDEKFNFDDLGNAIRKIQIDLGVHIRFVNLERLKRRDPDGIILTDANYCALGLIDYIAADGQPKNGPPTKDGFILYLKASYHGTESAAIRSYANTHPEFPHEGTLDQWFSESQFESYRALGFEITDNVITQALEDLKFPPTTDLELVFRSLWERARPPVATTPPAAA